MTCVHHNLPTLAKQHRGTAHLAPLQLLVNLGKDQFLLKKSATFAGVTNSNGM
jgi:hypothetical protein